MIMIEEPRKMVFRRPSGFPIKIVAIAPQKHPTLYEATAIPVALLMTWQALESRCRSYPGWLIYGFVGRALGLELFQLQQWYQSPGIFLSLSSSIALNISAEDCGPSYKRRQVQ